MFNKQKILIILINLCLVNCIFAMEEDRNLKRKCDESSSESERENKRQKVEFFQNNEIELNPMDIDENPFFENLNKYLFLPFELREQIFGRIIHASGTFEKALANLQSIYNFGQNHNDTFFDFEENIKNILKFLIYRFGIYKILSNKLPNFLCNIDLEETGSFNAVVLKFVLTEERLCNYLLADDGGIELSLEEMKKAYTKLILLGLENHIDRRFINRLIIKLNSNIMCGEEGEDFQKNVFREVLNELSKMLMELNWDTEILSENSRDNGNFAEFFQNHDYDDPLIFAVKANCHEIILKFISLNPTINYELSLEECGINPILDYATHQNCLSSEELEADNFSTLRLILEHCHLGRPVDSNCILWRDFFKKFSAEQTIQIIKILLNHGLDIDFNLGVLGETIININGHADYCKVLKFLLSRGGNIAKYQPNWAWPEKLEEFESLLTSFDINWFDPQNHKNLLMQIDILEQPEFVKVLLEKGIDINFRDRLGLTALMHAIKNTKISLEIIKLLLENKKINIDDRDNNGDSALIYAIMYKQWSSAFVPYLHEDDHHKRALEIIKLLRSFGANINLRNYKYQTPLMIAIENDELDIVKLLLEFDVELKFRDENGYDALMYAINAKNNEILKLILERNGIIENRDNNGNTPLMLAILSENFDAAKLLISKNKSMDYLENSNQKNQNALYLAVAKNNLEIITLLADKGVDLEAKKGRDLTSPLGQAAMLGYKEIVEFFISKGVNINSQNIYGITAFQWALSLRNREIAEMLYNRGADHSIPINNQLIDVENAKNPVSNSKK